MILKHSIKGIIRTPKKTILFLFLLIVLTITLSIGVGMYDSARNMLMDADETFTSVVELDYLGDVEQDEVGFYKNMNSDLKSFNFDQLSAHPSVKNVGVEKHAWAYIDENRLQQNNTPLSNYAMVRVGDINHYEEHLYMGIVKKVLFGKNIREEAYIMISELNEMGLPVDYDFKKDHEYLILGKTTKGMTPTYIMMPYLPEPVVDTMRVIDLTNQPDFFNTEEGKKIRKLEEAMKVVESSLPVTTVSSLEASSSYYFNELLLKEGRIFHEQEYGEEHNKVILISEVIAKHYQVGVGDKLNLKLHYNQSGVGRSDYLNDNKFDYEAGYEVVGIFENKDQNKFTIYMPEPAWLDQEFHSTTLARYVVKNGTGEKFIEDNKKNLLSNMKFTLYDQGYAESVKPILALKNSAAILIVLGVLAQFTILVLFSYLYVTKQKDTLRTMLSLGTGKKRTRNYVLYGAVSLILLGATLGAIISNRILDKVTRVIFKAMQGNYGTDLRYSERAIGLQMSFMPQIRISSWLPALMIVVVLVMGILILLSFTYVILREEKEVSARRKKKKEKTHLPREINVKKVRFGRIRPTSLKFALISLIRSPGRSFIVPIISFILSVFLIFIGLFSRMQQEKLDTVYDKIPVTTYMASLKDETRDIGGLDLFNDIDRLIDPTSPYKSEWDMRRGGYYDWSKVYDAITLKEEREEFLSKSKYFADMHLYSAIHYEFMGISKTKSGIEDKELAQIPKFEYHNNTHGFDWFLDKINKMPKLAYADDLKYTPEFFGDSEPEVDFLEGYSNNALRQTENIGLLSRNLAATYGIENGDTIRVTAWYKYDDYAICSVIDLKIVGIYQENWKTQTIYVPWVMGYDHSYHIDFEYPRDGNNYKNVIWNEMLQRRVRAVTFTLKNTEELSEFRDYLEAEDYSQVGKAGDKRRVIVIQDKRLMETVQSLKNQIRLIDTIRPIMMILFGIMGFVVSYLLIKHRMNEFAIMRSMGAKKRQVFFSFFLEQLLLFLIGLIPTAIYALVRPDQIILYGGSLLFFILCYLMGTAIALILMNRAKIIEMLFTKE